MDDFSEAFSGFLKTPLGVELIRTIKEDLHDNLVREAENSLSQENSYGLIKEASGVIKVLEHLQYRSVVLKGKGREDTK